MPEPGPPPLPPGHVRDPGDAWVEGPDGQRFWGRFGAAGLLVHIDGAVLLQHRVSWSHFGGTWGLPGGARRQGETAREGALREAAEEAGVPASVLEAEFEQVLDLGFWSYTTVVARARSWFEPVVGDAESVALRWVPFPDVAGLPLHPGFGAAWPGLRGRIES
ncbi:NUDIX domain-containing protein [Galbitalea sp. SE-J8]|uniref:NUDIX domain-containing protein n=1 Tax=Galbitalea sp. SE-J8 TaxID=3054952 RepID=UPI00259CED10|nr:NUDIX domain-containing protein [Galbitalea sp. SE-J8]MDM4764295.1 NUDIX domain-containing protein [Galbitalea sp. SE-J8]